ncbi:hypothetical protein QJS10_CPA08g00471 [Acorus calamus]|uniref:EamA domain-containing protein n=1 Tax=Acorus calamus TaxID=4465 RepID=A0AAV9EBC7_ACOCL|nr:hypothetical protein QJS10_CPA08g00471 [Acorus calamus]
MRSSADTVDGIADLEEAREAHEIRVIELQEAKMGGESEAEAVDDEIGTVEDDEISPLLVVENAAAEKMTIFSVSYPRKRPPRESTIREDETEFAIIKQFLLWTWGGSRYSGLLCMAASAIVYGIMEVFLTIFSARSIPLLESVFTRCTIICLLSFMWLKRTGQPLFGPTHARKLLLSRALAGFLSLLCFVYSVQRLPLSYSILLNFATPLMASVMARMILHEKSSFTNVGGLTCSFLGLLFTQQMFVKQGQLSKTEELNEAIIVGGSHLFHPILIGLLSSATGGLGYCLIRASSKATDQPLLPVFAFGLLASPGAAVCTFALQKFKVPDLYTFLLMVILGLLAFIAEVFLARGLHLDKISRVTNIQYTKVIFSQILGLCVSDMVPSFGRIIGCLLILASIIARCILDMRKR